MRSDDGGKTWAKGMCSAVEAAEKFAYCADLTAATEFSQAASAARTSLYDTELPEE